MSQPKPISRHGEIATVNCLSRDQYLDLQAWYQQDPASTRPVDDQYSDSVSDLQWNADLNDNQDSGYFDPAYYLVLRRGISNRGDAPSSPPPKSPLPARSGKGYVGQFPVIMSKFHQSRSSRFPRATEADITKAWNRRLIIISERFPRTPDFWILHRTDLATWKTLWDINVDHFPVPADQVPTEEEARTYRSPRKASESLTWWTLQKVLEEEHLALKRTQLENERLWKGLTDLELKMKK
ncbi:hypothetical protein G7Y89_g5193 [Cudoniella acicularis]|uniref:Uncharacterized protein n=1 Tax=Cudoniella acicularis TaxID=354080 RepID=A0A8H4RMY0_9HELO|nr:hypothetical protein G7Y89_g5193 [Cudoniella acicularis]